MSIPTSFNPMGTLGAGMPPGWEETESVFMPRNVVVDVGFSFEPGMQAMLEIGPIASSKSDGVFLGKTGDDRIYFLAGYGFKTTSATLYNSYRYSTCLLKDANITERNIIVSRMDENSSYFKINDLEETKPHTAQQVTQDALELNSSDYPCSARIYGIRISLGERDVLNLLPAKNAGAGLYGLYDSVGKKLLTTACTQ